MTAESLSQFADGINKIMPVLIRGFASRQANELYKGKLTLPQFFVLDFLEQRGESKMTDIARFMRVSTAAMTGIVDRLARDGYVGRASDAQDRRITRIRLTPKGSGLADRINQQRRQMVIDIFSNLSKRDRSQYLRILTQIKDILTRGEA